MSSRAVGTRGVASHSLVDGPVWAECPPYPGLLMDKAEILDEIRRLAAENGGVAPGKFRFLAETGITEGRVLGRYWARWSDAVREAGLQPNSLQMALPEQDVLDKLSLLVNELGRFPTDAERRLRHEEDPTFPSSKVFRRFGNKLGLQRGWSNTAELTPALRRSVRSVRR